MLYTWLKAGVLASRIYDTGALGRCPYSSIGAYNSTRLNWSAGEIAPYLQTDQHVFRLQMYSKIHNILYYLIYIFYIFVILKKKYILP